MEKREKEQTTEYWNKTKRDAMQFYAEACEDVERWEDVINDCDAEIAAIHSWGSIPIRALIVKFTLAFITFLVLLAIVSTTGCRSTLLGTGEVIYGLGKGGGTIVTGIGEYLIEEGQE